MLDGCVCVCMVNGGEFLSKYTKGGWHIVADRGNGAAMSLSAYECNFGMAFLTEKR